jgi:hypothetical protein
MGAEDAAEDVQDEGAPAKNEVAVVEPVPADIPVIEFYSKTPQYKEFSNFFPVKLSLDGSVWPTVEHYFQAMKFPANPEYQESIRIATTAAVAKRLGKTREFPLRSDWNTYRDTVMYAALKEKFSERHPELRDKLLATGDAILKEASPMDNYWGIGRSKKGQNKLGQLLMKIRSELRVAAAPAAPAALAAPAAKAEEPVLVAPPVEQEIIAAAITKEEAALPPPVAAAGPPVAPAAPPAAPAAPVAPAATSQQGPVLNIEEVSAAEMPPAEDNIKVIMLNAPLQAPKER